VPGFSVEAVSGNIQTEEKALVAVDGEVLVPRYLQLVQAVLCEEKEYKCLV
jgi:hypothetical protein